MSMGPSMDKVERLSLIDGRLTTYAIVVKECDNSIKR
jgi:hypothetical protein